MPESLYRYLASDHNRLDGLLDRAISARGAIDQNPYDAFRAALLRHIAMEERILFPAIARFQGGEQTPVVKQLRLEHGALSALLVPPPDTAVVSTLRKILSAHNHREEEEAGVYRLLERLAGAEGASLLEKLKATPPVPVAPYNTRPEVLEVMRRAVARAGYDFPPPRLTLSEPFRKLLPLVLFSSCTLLFLNVNPTE